MKNEAFRSRRAKIIAAACAVTVLAGGSAGIYAFSSSAPKTEEAEDVKDTPSASDKDSGIISAGGTVTSSQLSDTLGMKNTSVRLTVEEVLAEAGDSVTSGTELYKLTDDSVEKAKKTLESELKNAENELTKQTSSAQSDKIKAGTLYESQLLLKDTAQKEYDDGIAALDSDLKKAYDDYTEAQNTVNSTPGEITKKQNELNSKQASADSLQEKKNTAQKQLTEAGTKYSAAADSYNSLVTGYNSAASVVIYLGTALGKDVSDVALAQTVTAQLQDQSASSSARGGLPSSDGKDMGQFDMSVMQNSSKTSAQVSETSNAQARPQTTGSPTPQTPQISQENAGITDINILYENAYKEYTAAKAKLDQAKQSFTSAEDQYRTLSSSASQINDQLKEAQESVSSLSREISSLQSSLSKARSSLTKLRSEYNSLSSSYETDKLELQKKLDTDLASYENAEFHYELTCSTIDAELEEKQSAYDTAKENLSIFEEQLSDGYIRAGQDGTIYSLSGQAGRSIDSGSPFVYYVDRSDLTVTVELDQYDVTQIGIGDSVIIYSSETGMTNGKITAISAGESTSLADVKFNVTVAAEDNSKLYRGQSVNIYFNYSVQNSGSLKDFSGSGNGSEDSQRTRPSNMPEGFDPSNIPSGMPDGFDPSNMPSFGGRKGE